jgi:hypothetical protein
MVCVPGTRSFVVGELQLEGGPKRRFDLFHLRGGRRATFSVSRLRGGRSIRSANAQPWSLMRTASNEPGSVSTTCI